MKNKISWPHKRCGAKSRDGDPCKNWGMPNGRCRMHGGKSTGRARIEDTKTFQGAQHWQVCRQDATHIDTEVHVGSPRDAALYAVGTNSAHGIRRSNADKRRAVETLLLDDEWSRWSNNEIARRCVVSHTFVNSVREQLSRDGTEPPVKRKCADGRIIDTAKIGKPARNYGTAESSLEDNIVGAAASTDTVPDSYNVQDSIPANESVHVECIVAGLGAVVPGRTCDAFAMTPEEVVAYLQLGVVPHRANARMDDNEFFSLLLEYLERKESAKNTRFIVLREIETAVV